METGTVVDSNFLQIGSQLQTEARAWVVYAVKLSETDCFQGCSPGMSRQIFFSELKVE